uniref:Endonuclease-reverse transcriptase n=1 Tax=Cacopsylla melanoneura TaxID=428564 RepID=A0A8D9A949_9HEMI
MLWTNSSIWDQWLTRKENWIVRLLIEWLLHGWTGVLCDKRMNLKMKGKVYKTVVRPAMMYGAETWAMKKIHEKRLEVAEMRMLRWSCGVTRMDRIRNEVIRNKLRVTEVTKKIQERRMQWYGHVMRRDEDYVGKRVRRMEGAGRRARGIDRRYGSTV